VLFSALRRRPCHWRRHPRRTAVRRLAASRFISMAGTDASGVAIGYALFAQTHSPAWLSLSLMLTMGAGALLAPLGGRVADVLDRRRLMIGAELAASTVFLGLTLVHTPAILLALGLVATSIGAVFGPASGAAIAQIAGEEHLSWANSVVASGSNVGKAAGRLAAGAIIAALGVGGVFLLDALTFVASALLIASVHRAFSTERAAPAAEPERQRGSIRLLLGNDTVRLLTAAACMSTFATAFSMTAEVPLVFALGGGAVGLGALTACWGAGMVGGSWFGGRVLHRGNEATGVLAGRLAMALGVGLVAAAPSIGPALPCYVLGGVGGGFMGVAAQSLTLRSAPDHLRGRILGAIDACRNLAFGLGVVGAGAMVTLLGPQPVYALVGLTMALGTIPVATLVVRLGGPRALRPALST
jgi:MFS family permease